MILIIDNYDSFTYNLYQCFEEQGFRCKVIRNDAITVEKIRRMKPSKIVISPGPGSPESSGVSLDILRELKGEFPILGVCLGHQAIGHIFGGQVIRAKRLMHGKSSLIYHDGKGVMKGLPNPFEGMRYHSLVVSKKGFPKELTVSARTSDGIIMGLRHKRYPIEGVQFHPESLATAEGKKLLRNFASGGKK